MRLFAGKSAAAHPAHARERWLHDPATRAEAWNPRQGTQWERRCHISDTGHRQSLTFIGEDDPTEVGS
jgi:hypothetical protein